MTFSPGGRKPTRVYRCATCNVEFTAQGTSKGGCTGKVCPSGHWHSIYELVRHERGKSAKERKFTDGIADGQTKTKRAAKSLIGRFRVMGFATSESQAHVALAAWLASYEHLIHQLPTGSLRGLVDGQFSRIAEITREMVSRG